MPSTTEAAMTRAIHDAAVTMLVAQERIDMLTGPTDTDLAERLAKDAHELLAAVAGVGPDEGEPFYIHPLVVEVTAAASEEMAEYVAGFLYFERAREIREHQHAAWEACQPLRGGRDA